MEFGKMDLKRDFTARKTSENMLFEHKQVDCETETMLYLKINPKQLDGSSYENFNAIKTNVHSLIKKQGLDERVKAREMRDLRDLMDKIKEEDGTIFLKNEENILNFEIDNISKSIIMILENGKIAVSQINSRKISLIQKGCFEARCYVFNLEIEEEVTKILWLKKDHMALVLENSILVISLRTGPEKLKSFYIFNNEINAETGSPITEARFSPKHHCFYVRIQEKENENLIYKFETDFFSMTESSSQVVPIEISNFRESDLQPGVLLAVSGEKLVRFRLNEGGQPVDPVRDSLQSKLTRVETFKKMESFNRKTSLGGLMRVNSELVGSQRETSLKYFFREEVVYRANDQISGLKIDWKGKMAYLNVENEVLKVNLETLILELTFQGHEFNISSFIFSKDFKLMFTQDENGIVRIWKTETGRLHATLGYSFPSEICKLALNDHYHLLVNHPQGIKIWKLQNPPFLVDPDDLSQSPKEIVLTGKEMMWVRSTKSLNQVMQRNNQTVKKKPIFDGFKIEDEEIRMLPSGDLLLKNVFEPEKGKVREKTRLVLQACVDPQNEKAKKKKVRSESEVFELQEFKKDSTIELGIETDLKVILAEIDGRVTCLSITTNFGLKWPKVFENGVIVSKPVFIEAHSEDKKIEMTIGTDNGDCLKVKVLFDKNKRIKTQEIEKEVTSWKPSKTYISPKEENERELLSVSTETDGPTGMSGHLHSGINAYQRFGSHETEVFLFCSKPRVAKKAESQTQQDLAIFARSKYESWSRLNVSLASIIEVREDQYFKLVQIDRKASKESLRFCVYNQFAVILLEYETTSGLLSLVKMLPMSIAEGQELMYSEKLNQFYIPTKETIQIWDGLLQILQTTIEFEAEILQTTLVQHSRPVIFVYDRKNYYELDLGSLSFQRKQNYSSELGKPLIINSDLFEVGVPLRVPNQDRIFGCVKLIGENDPLNLISFPIEAFPKCFEEDVHKEAIMEYAEYYFDCLDETNNRDLFYGPLSPLLFAVYHNDTDLLSNILSKYGYPTSVRSYWSPLSFSFRFNFPSTMKIICDYILKNSEKVEISRQDFIFLLNSEKDFCHRVLSQVPAPPKVPYVPSLVTMNDDVSLVYVPSINDLMDLLKDNELSANMLKMRTAREVVEKNTIRKTESNRGRGVSVFDRFQENMFMKVEESSKSEVEVLQVPFQYDYRAGTPDSIRFLDMYSKSECEEFVSSAWKEVVSEKWNKVWLFHIGFSLLYISFTAILTLSLVFHPKEWHISDEISKVLIFVFFIYEIMQLVSYAFFNINNYIMDPWNIIDWACFILLLVYFYHSQDDDIDHFQEQLMAIVSLLVVYYRNFSYLRVIKPLTTFVGIITVVFQKLVVFGFILFYFYLVTALLMVRLFPDDDPWECFGNAYFWAFFGAASPEDFQRSPFAVIVIVFGSIIVTVILLNILIAYLSNIFCRLEDQQHIDYFREKAAMILDVEIIMWFVNYRLTKKSSGDPRSALDRRPRKRTQLFIIKTLDFQDMTQEEEATEGILRKVDELGSKMKEYQDKSQKAYEKLSLQNKMLMQRLDRFAARFNVATQ